MNRNHDETSEALLAASHRLLAEHGPDALTVRRIATEAGMSTMNVYSRFGGKDGVIDELYADGYRRLFAELAAVAESDDVRTYLFDMARAYRDFAQRNPAYYGIMFRSTVPGFEPSPEALDLALGGLELLVTRIRTAQEAGQIVSASGESPLDVAAWLWATCHGMVSLELDEVGNEQVDWPKTFEFGVRIALDGLHPAAAAAATTASPG